MIFDPTITLGSIITALAMLCGGLAFVWAMKSDIRVLAASITAQGERLTRVETTMSDVTKTMVQLARQEERLNAHDRRMDDLARGEGFVLPISRSARELGGG